LPKGSTIVVNTWGLNMDPEKWGPDVEEFNPDRYKDYPLLAPEYAASSDWSSRDHHAYGKHLPTFLAKFVSYFGLADCLG
jgi:cytochrome P450